VLYVVLLTTGNTASVVALANVAAIAAMAVINVGAIAAMRDRDGGGVRLPGGPVLPALGLVTAVSQLFFLQWMQVLVGLGLLGAGVFVYLARRRFHHPALHAELQAKVAAGDTPGTRAVGGRKRLGVPSH
jgi:hypothetical protein